MRLSAFPLAALLIGMALPAHAACYADYKAKQDAPLRLHYGVMQVAAAACSGGDPATEMRQRLAAGGWTLLNVISVFGPEGLPERKANAGAYHLRY